MTMVTQKGYLVTEDLIFSTRVKVEIMDYQQTQF